MPGTVCWASTYHFPQCAGQGNCFLLSADWIVLLSRIIVAIQFLLLQKMLQNEKLKTLPSCLYFFLVLSYNNLGSLRPVFVYSNHHIRRKTSYLFLVTLRLEIAKWFTAEMHPSPGILITITLLSENVKKGDLYCDILYWCNNLGCGNEIRMCTLLFSGDLLPWKNETLKLILENIISFHRCGRFLNVFPRVCSNVVVAFCYLWVLSSGSADQINIGTSDGLQCFC